MHTHTNMHDSCTHTHMQHTHTHLMQHTRLDSCTHTHKQNTNSDSCTHTQTAHKHTRFNRHADEVCILKWQQMLYVYVYDYHYCHHLHRATPPILSERRRRSCKNSDRNILNVAVVDLRTSQATGLSSVTIGEEGGAKHTNIGYESSLLDQR
jgi:hypothetical protein